MPRSKFKLSWGVISRSKKPAAEHEYAASGQHKHLQTASSACIDIASPTETSTEERAMSGLSDNSPPIKCGDEKMKSHQASICKLWEHAYERLREENKNLLNKYEERLFANLKRADSTTRCLEITRDSMDIVLHNKMEEVNRNAWKLKFCGTEVKVKDIAEPILGLIKWTNDYIECAVSTNPTASIAWTGISIFLPLLLNLPEQAAVLASGLETISTLIAQSKVREELYIRRHESNNILLREYKASDTAFKDALEALYVEILRFQATCYCYLTEPACSRLVSDLIKWNDWSALIHTVCEKNEAFVSVSELWKDVTYQQEWEATQLRHRESLARLDGIFRNLSGLREAIKNNQEDGMREKTLEWLCDTEVSDVHNIKLNKYTPGTCDWLIDRSATFKAWEDSPRSFLWLHGKAGSGKSVLSSSVIEYLRDRHKSNPLTAVAFFYFSFQDATKQTAVAMLASLIRQFCSCRPNMPQTVDKLRDQKASGIRPDRKMLEKMLIESARGFSTVYIVLDGLDECPLLNQERRNLLETLINVVRTLENAHIICTSRKETDIDTAMSRLSLSTSFLMDVIDLTDQDHREVIYDAIGLYIDEALAKDEFNSWAEATKAEAKERLLDKADGMFQYVYCQLTTLQDCKNDREVGEALDSIPDGLYMVYERMLDKFNKKDENQILNVLRWLVCSKRLLTVAEVAEIFILHAKHAEILDIKARLWTPQDVLKYLPSLVILDASTNRVKLAHYSVKEFLTSSYISPGPGARFAFDDVTANLHVARSCLAYHLQLDHLKKNLPLASFHLQWYISYFWPAHLEVVPRELWPTDILTMALAALMTRSNSLRNMITMSAGFESSELRGNLGVIHANWMSYRSREDLILRPFRYTAQLGCVQLTDALLSQNEYLVQEDLDLVLQDAACRGSIELVEMALQRGADINAKSPDFGDALQAASAEGNTEMVHLLIEHKADINAQSIADLERPKVVYGSAIQAAAAHGQLHIVQLLMDHGAKIESPCEDARCCVLASAVSLTSLTCLRFLLEQGVKMNKETCTALHDAVLENNDAAVRLLLDYGANVNAQGGTHGNALHAACYHQNFNMIRFLVSRGASVNAVVRGGKFTTALQLACFAPKVEIVRFLVENGADVNAVAGAARSPLQLAYRAENGMEAVKLLLEAGAEVEASAGGVGLELQAATARGDTKLVEMLLSVVDRGSTMEDYINAALHGACARRNLPMVRTFLKHGAKANADDGTGNTPLQNAVSGPVRCTKSILAIVHLLLEHGANVHTESGQYGSAWHALAAAKYPSADDEDALVKIMQLFLDRGVDINDARGRQHATALQGVLQKASRRQCHDNVKRISFLLARGADANLAAGKYGLPLQWACTSGRVTRVKFLLDNCPEIKVNAESGLFSTALQAAVHTGVVALVRLLLDRGADVNIRGGKYGSALNAAVIKGYWDLVKMLVEAGARPDCRLADTVDERFVLDIKEEHGRGAAERYVKFFEVCRARARAQKHQ